MSKLEDLKAAATAKLGSVHADVLSYISALEATLTAHRTLYIVTAVALLVIGGLIGHALKR